MTALLVSCWLAAVPDAAFVSPFVKVRPGMALPGARAAHLQLLRGECEGFQLQVREGLELASVEAPPLAGPGSLAVRLFVEGYVALARPSNPEGSAGAWPDPLLPVHRARWPRRSTPGEPLVLYGEVCAPAGQPPGEYRGVVRLLPARGGSARELPLSASVLGPGLPATSTRPNTFGISLYSVAHGHGLPPDSAEARALLAAYARSALTHRVSLHGMGIDPLPTRLEGGKLEVDFTAYDAELGPFLDGTALPSGARFSTADVRDDPRLPPSARAQLYGAFERHFEERGWRPLLFFYAKDEPSPADFPLVHAQARAVRAGSHVPVLVTSPLDRRVLGAADILAPVLNCFFPRPGPATCPRPSPAPELRRALGGRRLFWYQSCLSHGCGEREADAATGRAFTGWASYMVDHPVALNRAMGPLAFLAGVDGELYFATVYQYDHADPWEDLRAFGGNGDGTLFYPGTPVRLPGGGHVPVESLRLKALRDGLEDDEALQLLARLGGAGEARALVLGVARSGHDISREPARWEAFRAQLLAALNARWTPAVEARERGRTRTTP